jgi:hypothetical protein
MAPQTQTHNTNTEDDTFERLLAQINTAFENRDQLSQQREQEREQRFLATMIEQIRANSAPPHQPSSSVLGPDPHSTLRTLEAQPETHTNRNLRLTFPRFPVAALLIGFLAFNGTSCTMQHHKKTSYS